MQENSQHVNTMDETEITLAEATHDDVPNLLQMMGDFNALLNYPFDSATPRDNLEEFLTDKRLGRILDYRVGECGGRIHCLGIWV